MSKTKQSATLAPNKSAPIADDATPPNRKVTSNHRLTPEGKRLLVLLAEHLGLDQTGVIETLIRERAKSEKIN